MVGRTLALVVALATLILGTAEAAVGPHFQVLEPAGSPGILDLGTVEVFATSAPKRIRVRNIGDEEPYIFHHEIEPPFMVVGQGGSLAPGGIYYWDIVVAPDPDDLSGCACGGFGFYWIAHDDDDDGSGYVALDSTVTPSPYTAELQSFGYVEVGGSATLTVPVTNDSPAPREITALSVADGPFTAQLHGGSLPITVAAGASFWVELTFAPFADLTFYRTHLTVLDGTGPHGAFRIYGTGIAAQLALSTSSLAFGDAVRSPSSPPTAEVQLTNVGIVTATLPAATITGSGFTLVSSPSGPLPPQGSATYVIAFEPDSVGAFHGTLELGGSGQVALSGQGVLRPVSAAAQLDLGVAFVGSSVRRALSLHNAGSVSITVASLAFSDPRFSVASADRTIPPLGELVVEIEYAPTAEEEVIAELAIALDVDPEPQLAVALRGAGLVLDPPTDPTPVDPPLSFAPGAAPEGPGPAAGCSAHGGSAPLAALALAALLRRRRGRGRKLAARTAA